MTEDIRIYDFEFNLLHIEHKIKSSYWTYHFNDIGTFEGTFPLSENLLAVLFSSPFLILTQGKRQAIITGKVVDDLICVYGKTVNWILSRRTVSPMDAETLLSEGKIKSKTCGELIRYAVENAFPDISEKRFCFLCMAESVKEVTYSKNKREYLSFAVKKILEEAGLGHRVVADIKNKQWRLEVYRGKEREEILSSKNRNISNLALTEDCQNYINSGYYEIKLCYEGTVNPNKELPEKDASRYGSYYKISYEEGENQLSRYPEGAYLVCDDEEKGSWNVYDEIPALYKEISGDKSGIYKWEGLLDAENHEDAYHELNEKMYEKKISGENVTLKNKGESILGDTVRLQIEKNGFKTTVRRKIDGIESWFENGNSGEKIIFKEE